MKGIYDLKYLKNCSKGLTPYFYCGLNNRNQRIWSKEIKNAKEFALLENEIDNVLSNIPIELRKTNIHIFFSNGQNLIVLVYWK